jgi:hypothetical protein
MATIQLDVVGQFNIDDVLPYAICNKEDRHLFKRTYTVNGVDFIVKMDSERYQTFKNSIKCAACSLTGSLFLLEREHNHAPNIAHFNLYAVENNSLILLTKDHIVPRSKGGKNNISNYQTMCEICNSMKKNNEINNNELKQMRQIFNSL